MSCIVASVHISASGFLAPLKWLPNGAIQIYYYYYLLLLFYYYYYKNLLLSGSRKDTLHNVEVLSHLKYGFFPVNIVHFNDADAEDCATAAGAYCIIFHCRTQTFRSKESPGSGKGKQRHLRWVIICKSPSFTNTVPCGYCSATVISMPQVIPASHLMIQ